MPCPRLLLILTLGVSFLHGRAKADPVPDHISGPDLDVPVKGTDSTGQREVVPGVRLEPVDRAGRTYAEGSPFVIWGGTRSQRSSLFTAAGLVRRSVLDALHLPDKWSHPIIIQLRERLSVDSGSKPPVWTTISQVEGGFRMEINLTPVRQSVPGPLLRENLVRAILADRVLEGKESLDLTGAPAPPPDWILHGTLALIDYREEGRQSQTFSRVFRLGRVLSVQDILDADPEGMDSLSRTIYRVSCGGLLLMLVEQPKGPEQLARLLPTFAHPENDHASLIGRAFPQLGDSANSLSKWWSLQIAALSQPGLEEVQDPAGTGRLLDEALVLQLNAPSPPEKKASGRLKQFFSRGSKAPSAGSTDASPVSPSSIEPETCSLNDYARVLALENPAAVFNRAELALTRLMLRAHPVYRPIILEYQEILRSLAKGKTGKQLPATLARLSSTRERLATTIQGIENHLDWYETMQSSTPTGLFEDYLKAADELDRERPGRGDPLSRYLDQVEAESHD